MSFNLPDQESVTDEWNQDANSPARATSNSIFAKHYKDITFDTLKERHDNFSFDKVIATKQKVYNTMHFQNITGPQANMNLIIFGRQARQDDKYSYEKYQSQFQNTSAASSYYNSKPHSRPGDRKSHVSDLIDENQKYSIETFSTKRLSNQQRISQDHLDPRMSKTAVTKATESDLWKEFSHHFKNKKRPRVGANHHDFLLSTKEKHQVGSISSQPYSAKSVRDDAASYLLDQDRILRAKKTYQQMKLTAIVIPAKDAQKSKEQSLMARRARERHAVQEKLKRQQMLEAKKRAQNNQNTANMCRAQRFDDAFNRRQYPDRRLFVIADGQDLLKSDPLLFTYIEINHRMCKMIPQKVWESKGAQRLDLYQRIDLSKPSKLLQKQVVLETLEEVSESIKHPDGSFTHAFMIDGTPFKSFMDIHQGVKIIIVGHNKIMQGVRGVEQFVKSLKYGLQRPRQIITEVKPKPETWVQTAAVSWLKKNPVEDIPNYVETANQFVSTHDAQGVEEGSVIEALRDEHHRVHLQDRDLLNIIQQDDDIAQRAQYNEQDEEAATERFKFTRQQEPKPQVNSSLYAIRPLCIVEEDLPYRYQELEENIIKFLYEKIVVMREVPFMKAYDNLERNQNIARIYEQIRTLAPSNKVYENRRQQEMKLQQVDLTMLKTTQAYDGAQGEDIRRAGGVTFKVKKESSQPNLKPAQDEKAIDQGRMLQNEEVREIETKHALKRSEIFHIRAEFACMCKESEAYELGQREEQDSDDQFGGMDHKQKQQVKKQKDTEFKVDGISVEYFIKYCAFLSGSMPHINKRILIAQGLDVESQNVIVNWQTYLDLYCIFEAGQVEKSHKIKFWIKFFDQSMKGFCEEQEYMTLLEELVRGNCLQKANEATRIFPKIFQEQMRQAGCLGERNEIINDKLQKAFEDEKIDIQLLCSALGRLKLDGELLKLSQEDVQRLDSLEPNVIR